MATETDSNNCTSSDEVLVDVFNKPDISSLDTTIILGDIVNLHILGADRFTFNWDIEELGECSNCDFKLDCPDCNERSIRPLREVN